MGKAGAHWEQLVANQVGTNYYFGGKLIKNASGSVDADRLGSIGHYYPYGQEKPSATTNGTEKFTGYMRDAETGLDYAVNRYHASGTGRFLTPDPSMASANSRIPGSWNRYAYALGDPVKHTDPQGLDVVCGTDADGTYHCWDDDPQPGNKDTNNPSDQAVGDGSAKLDAEFDGSALEEPQTSLKATKKSSLQIGQDGLNAVKNAIAKAVATDPNNLFTASELDCISGIETGRTWDPASTSSSGTRVGLFQFNQASWGFSGTSINWNGGASAMDPYTAASVALGLLYRNLGINGGANPTPAKIQAAIDHFGQNDGKYGQAVMDCAKQLDAGNFSGAFATLQTYANGVKQ